MDAIARVNDDISLRGHPYHLLMDNLPQLWHPHLVKVKGECVQIAGIGLKSPAPYIGGWGANDKLIPP